MMETSETSQPYQRKVTRKMTSSLKLGRRDDFPDDIIHIILSFYVINFKHLLFCRQINQTWKHLCDHSPIWLTLDLSFAPPPDYILNYSTDSQINFGIEEEPEGNLNDLTRRHRSDRITHFIPLLQNERTFPQKLLYIVLREEIDEQQQPFHQEGSPVVRSERIRRWFHRLYCHYQQYWKTHMKWKQFYQTIFVYIDCIPFYCFLFLLFLFPVMNLTSAIQAFESIGPNSHTHSSGSMNNQSYLIGFRYLYSVIGFYFFVLFAFINLEIIFLYFFAHLMDFNVTWYSLLDSCLSSRLFLYLVGILGSIIAIECKLLNEEGEKKSLPWVVATIPIWIAAGIIWLRGFKPMIYFRSVKNSSKQHIWSIICFSIPTVALINSLAMDGYLSNHATFQLLLWMFLPVSIAFLLLPISLSIASILERKYYLTNISRSSWLSFLVTSIPIFTRSLTNLVGYIFLLVVILFISDGYHYPNHHENNKDALPFLLPNKVLLLINVLQIWLCMLGFDLKLRQLIYDYYTDI